MTGKPLDLRTFLDYASGLDVGGYLAIDKKISPKYETTAVVSGLVRKMRSPVIRFNDVSGCNLPVVTNVCSSLDRIAKSVDLSVDALNDRLQQSLQNGQAFREIAAVDAPAREIVRKTGEFSLSEFPALYYSAGQTAPYITAAIVVARDPRSGAHNLSFHRLMVNSNREAGIYMTPGGHLDQIWRQNRAAGNDTQIAAVIGTHPLWCLAALTAGELDADDYEVVGSVCDQALDVVAGLGDPGLMIPAHAEMVLEGRIKAEKTAAEGPFGEFLGFEAEKDDRPVVVFESLSSRREPIFQDIVAGQIEHMTMSGVSLRARLQREYFAAAPAVVDFWLPAGLTLFLAVDSQRQPAFDAHAMMHLLLQKERFLKQVVCFDAGTNLRKLADVQAALANFVQPDRDIDIISDCDGNGVDPSEIDGKTAKIAIDARPKSKVTRTVFPSDFVNEFDLSDWL